MTRILISLLAVTFFVAACSPGAKQEEKADTATQETEMPAESAAAATTEMTPEQIFEQEFVSAAIQEEPGMVAKAPEGATMYDIDPANSTIMWRGYKLGETGDHYGTIGVESSQIAMADGMVEAGNVVIDMTSINDVDLAEDPDDKAKLEGHLKSEDFFAVEQYPNATIDITGVEAAEGDNQYSVSANMTLKGTTHEITFPATITTNDNMANIRAMFTFDRAKYNVKWGSNSFPDLIKNTVLSDDIQLYLDLTTTPMEATAMMN